MTSLAGSENKKGRLERPKGNKEARYERAMDVDPKKKSLGWLNAISLLPLKPLQP